MSKLVYLAGPIIGNTYEEANEWREKAIEEFAKYGIKGVNPLRGKEFLRKFGKLEDGITDDFLATDPAIRRRDKWDVSRSDAILFNLLGAKIVSIGTMIEYGWADSYNKIVATIMEKPQNGNKNIHEHPMVRDISTYRVETLDMGITAVKMLFH